MKCTADSYHKGKDYFDNGKVLYCALDGMRVVGLVQGTEENPYSVTLNLNEFKEVEVLPNIR